MRRHLRTFILLLLVAALLVPPVWADATNPKRDTLVSGISAGEYSLVTEMVQNSSELSGNQFTVTTNGSMVYFSGSSMLPLPAETDGYSGAIIANFRIPGDKVVTGYNIKADITSPTTGSLPYSFSASKDLSELEDGIYQLCVWRGFIKSGKFEYNKEGATILNNTVLLKVSSGKPKIIQYNNVVNANRSAINTLLSSYNPSDFLDTSLFDIDYANKDVLKSETARALTATEQKYIKTTASSIVAGITDDYDKIQAIYDFVAENFYYDKGRTKNTGETPAMANAYINLKAFMNQETNGYNAESGKVATNCVGYAALVAALARSVGIPCAIVAGTHGTGDKSLWDQNAEFGTMNHHWNMCYVNGAWLMLDANMGSGGGANKFKDGAWTSDGLTNYNFFDSTVEQISRTHLITAVYVPPKSINSCKVTLNSDSVVYAGKEAKPTVTVKTASGAKLTKGTDYKVSYSNNNAIGTGTVTVTGIGTYTGSVKLKFSITMGVVDASTIKASDKTTTGFKIKWSSVPGADGYMVAYRKLGATKWKTSTLTSNTKTLSKLLSSTAYQIKIKAYRLSDGKKVYTDYSDIVTVATKPQKVELTAPATGSKYVTAKWTAVPRASGYEINIATNTKFSTGLKTKTLTDGTKESYKFTKLKAGTTYYVRVRAYFICNGETVYGSWSSYKSIKCK